MSKISIIIPCYYNELNIPVTAKTLIENENNFPQGTDFEYVMVNDGSKDRTMEELLNFQKNYPTKVKVINLVKNVGSSNAVLCGMHHATGDCCVILAADLQDPPELLPKMFEYWQKGLKLVLAQKTNREDSLLTKMPSGTFHYMMRNFALPNAPKGGFDLWLFDKQVKEDVIKMDEKNAYIPYLFIWLGYEYVAIPYTRRKRELGTSGWTMSKKIKSFIDSFVAFSFFPLRFITTVGLFLGFITLLYGFYILVSKLTGQIKVEGWSAMMIVFLFVSSFQMIALGIIGEYVWRTLDASRNRPNFVEDKVYDTVDV